VTLPPPGWYPDPNEPSRNRYWSGERWTDDYGLSVGGGQFAPVTVASPTSFRIDDPASITLDDVNTADDRVQLLNILSVGGYVVTGILFAVWFQRCYKNAQNLGALDLRFSSGWAAGAWFVPFLNLVRPKQMVDDVWKSADPSVPPYPNRDWMSKRGAPLLDVWWGFFIGAAIVNRVVATWDDTDSPTTLRTMDRVAAGTRLITIAGAVLAAMVVRRLTDRLEQRAAALGATS
jgi:hypothetical protein